MQAGTYTVICVIPGHEQLGMTMKLTVAPAPVSGTRTASTAATLTPGSTVSNLTATSIPAPTATAVATATSSLPTATQTIQLPNPFTEKDGFFTVRLPEGASVQQQTAYTEVQITAAVTDPRVVLTIKWYDDRQFHHTLDDLVAQEKQGNSGATVTAVRDATFNGDPAKVVVYHYPGQFLDREVWLFIHNGTRYEYRTGDLTEANRPYYASIMASFRILR